MLGIAKKDILWSHSLADYRQMFDLSDDLIQGTILEYGAAASSFNHEMAIIGRKVISFDTYYGLDFDALKQAIQLGSDNLSQLMAEKPEQFLWNGGIDEAAFKQQQQHNAEIFLADFPTGLVEARYCGDIATLAGFKDYQFDLALCSHIIFSVSARNPLEFQFHSLRELCRVAKEARVFPMLDAKGEIAESIGPLMAELQNNKYGVEICEVPYHLQRGGNAMMRVWSNKCPVQR